MIKETRNDKKKRKYKNEIEKEKIKKNLSQISWLLRRKVAMKKKKKR